MSNRGLFFLTAVPTALAASAAVLRWNDNLADGIGFSCLTAIGCQTMWRLWEVWRADSPRR